MNSDIAIKVENVSKKYCKSLKHSMLYGVMDIGKNIFGLSSHSDRLRPDEFWAVDDASFEVKRGETLGLIGSNGSGKTTLLKMLNGIFWPDKGKITTKGRVGALIAVGAGFHPMLTGRENIYISGAILGMSKTEVNKRFDAIVDFADIGDFLDSPVKHYSSGMFVRLGFAVAAHCEPDILLIDEILAVGDTSFQSKCYAHIADLIKKGVAIILVSHNMDAIRQVCRNTIFINKSKVIKIGESNTVVLNYLKQLQEEVKKALINETQQRKKTLSGNAKKGQIKNVSFFDEHGTETNNFKTGDTIKITMEYEAFEEINNPVFAIHFFANGFLYASFISNNGFLINKVYGKGSIELYIPHIYLPADVYDVNAVFSKDVEFNHIDWHNQKYFLKIGERETGPGLVSLPHSWSMRERETKNHV